jgi:hypothetical protein
MFVFLALDESALLYEKTLNFPRDSGGPIPNTATASHEPKIAFSASLGHIDAERVAPVIHAL